MELSLSDSSVLGISIAPSIIWVYLDLGYLDKAENLINKYLVVYPKSTTMIRAHIRLLLKQKKFTEAITIAEKLSKISFSRNPINWSDYFSGGEAIMEACVALNNRDKGIETADHFLSAKYPKNIGKIKWVQKHIKSINKMKVTLVNSK